MVPFYISPFYNSIQLKRNLKQLFTCFGCKLTDFYIQESSLAITFMCKSLEVDAQRHTKGTGRVPYESLQSNFFKHGTMYV